MIQVHVVRSAKWLFALMMVGVILASGCGGGSSATPDPTPPAAISVTVAPTTASVQTGATTMLTATVANDTAAKGVNWTVSSGGGSVAPTGSASGAAVTYTAPATVPGPATVTVTATSVSDGTKTGSATITVTAAPANISISVSPTTGTVTAGMGQQLTATVQNDTGSKGVIWTVSSGGGSVNPANSASGQAVTYTPVGCVTAPTTVTVTATSVTDTTKTASATLTVNPVAVSGNIGVSISPARGGLTLGQTLNIAATVTNDTACGGVTFAPSSGTITPVAGSTTTATFTAPTSPGVVTITATSVADGTKTATATIGVTDLGGVTEYHNDPSRDGANLQEYALTPTNVNANTFGKLFSCAVDGAVYGQPLWIANVAIGTATHNVIVVATAHNSVYAFDADVNTTPCQPLWHANLIDSDHGGAAGETSIPSGITGNLVAQGFGDITPETGVIGTPVINVSNKTIYVVSQSVVASSGPTFFRRLHALDLTTGADKLPPASVTTQNTTFPGNADGGAAVAFNPKNNLQRAGLALSSDGSTVYVCWGSHEDLLPYYGWVVAYNAATLVQKSTFSAAPNLAPGEANGEGQAGIWMSGGAPSFDPSHNFLYLITGNGVFGAANDFGDSFVKLSAADLTVADSFTPFDQADMGGVPVPAGSTPKDADLGAGGAALLINLPSTSPHQQLLIGGGKGTDFAGKLYVLDPNAMGGAQNGADTSSIQEFSFGHALFSTGAFWQNTLYVAGVNGPAMSFPLDPNAGMFSTTPSSQSTAVFNFPGSTPSVSSLAATNGILWLIDSSTYGVNSTHPSRAAGPAILRAYSATDLTTELWDSTQAPNGRDTAGNAVKFTVPTVANGKVYIGTRGNDNTLGSGSTLGELDVYGLLP